MRPLLIVVFVAGCGIPVERTPPPEVDLEALIAADPDYGRGNWWGDRPDFAACSHGGQCQSGRCSTAGAACGVCLQWRRLGQSCGAPNQVCSFTATCRDGVCQSWKRTAGGLCTQGPKGGNGDDCDDELVCIAASVGAPTTCQRPLPVGATCNAWNACRPGANCSAKGICTAVVYTPAPSTRCAGGGACPAGTACDDQDECREDTIPLGGNCGHDGQGYAVRGRCAAGTVCGNLEHRNSPTQWNTPLTCLALPGDGETAISHRCARGLFVDPSDPSLRCQPTLPQGQLCRSEEWCAGGLECRGTCEVPCN